MEMKRLSFGRTTLQIIAALMMLCDHVAYVFVDSYGYEAIYETMRVIGRISFPIFCFLLVQGFLTTSNIKKYILRILVFAILSEIPFDLAFFGSSFYQGAQNVMFTMLIGLLTLCGLKKYETNMYFKVGILILGCLSAYWLHTDYSYMGVALIVIFYMMRGNALSMIFWAALLFFVDGGMQFYAVLALPFCTQYSAEKEERRLPRYFFYAFYPVHLLVLWGIYIYIILFQ